MQDIDFLPADYVCLRETPPSNSGPCVWLVVAVTLIATSWGTMTCVTNQLVARRNELHRQSRDLHAKLGLSQTLLHEWTAVEHEERLIGLLRLQAAPSRWLSAIRQAMPPQLSLSEIGSTFAGESETKPLSRPLEANSIDHGERSPLEQDLGVCPDTRRVGTAHHNRSLMVGSAHPTEGMTFAYSDRHLAGVSGEATFFVTLPRVGTISPQAPKPWHAQRCLPSSKATPPDIGHSSCTRQLCQAVALDWPIKQSHPPTFLQASRMP